MISTTLFSIAEIVRETGISSDTLRVWERRYGFPVPLRNQRNERQYTHEQLSRLRLLKQLLDGGLRPGKIVTLDEQQLRRLTASISGTTATSADVEALLSVLTCGSRYTLLSRMEELLKQHGLRSFLTEVVAPMNQAVGDAWATGLLGVFDEHYYAEQVRRVLTSALADIPPGTGGLRVLLTTLPGELHGIGILMVACMLNLEGAQVLLTGVQMPLDEIVRGAVESGCNIVGISCSAHMGRRSIASQLVQLCKLLPGHIAIWAGGSGVRSLTFLQDRIRLFTDLEQIPGAIRDVQQNEGRINTQKESAS
jgi:DNA-binding transcriptional MerR regulator/methylmalonyl-CoA mutase cobalamin-binding subunit